MARSMFVRNYDKGEITLPNGDVIDVKTLPENSINFFSVYGFIRACQDPFGGEKIESVKAESIIKMAKELIAGTLTKEARSSAKTPEDKLNDLYEKLEAQKGFLESYIVSSDDEKRFAAKMGINRTGYEKEIARLAKAIVKMKTDIDKD